MINLVSQLNNNISAFETELPSVFEGLWPSLAVMIATVISLGILLFFITYYGYFPIKKYIHERKKYIQNNLESAEKLNVDANKMLRAVEATEKNSRIEFEKQISESISEGNQLKKEIINDAKIEAKKIYENSKSESLKEGERIKEEISNNLYSIILEATQRILEKEVDEKVNEKLVNDLLKEFKDAK